MKPLKLKISLLGIFCFFSAANFCFAQQGNIVINQDKKIATLLEIKKEVNKNDSDSDRYKIQIYSGQDRQRAESTQREFSSYYEDWAPSIQYETPNFKIWAGNFRTRLEADRALKKIKKDFPNAFIFKPKRHK
jgi:hypothetical protein